MRNLFVDIGHFQKPSALVLNLKNGTVILNTFEVRSRTGIDQVFSWSKTHHRFDNSQGNCIEVFIHGSLT